jgi:NAD(P)-dependent dehydrogenase (short-subunit alcohol dehydrogenase family)
MQLKDKTALIVGAGAGLSASLARVFAKEGMRIALASRTTGDLEEIRKEIGAAVFACDATVPEQVKKLFSNAADQFGAPDVVIYNASYRTRGALIDLDAAEVEKSIKVSAFGGFLVAQEAARRMLARKEGAIFFTGASASVKGYALSAPFAMGKFALRGLAQSLARELSPQGIHVAHFVIDGGIRGARKSEPEERPDSMLDPAAIAESYLAILKQPRNAWSLEVELRPWVEKF